MAVESFLNDDPLGIGPAGQTITSPVSTVGDTAPVGLPSDGLPQGPIAGKKPGLFDGVGGFLGGIFSADTGKQLGGSLAGALPGLIGGGTSTSSDNRHVQTSNAQGTANGSSWFDKRLLMAGGAVVAVVAAMVVVFRLTD
ncbi:hypothetical protein [Poriferisphaera sp. WC338]|uniref:hypothetical protein n=1 Tax=Poriferisphaera sp. WC338 TaxID=3425129 RepID=UPI003D8129D1